MTRNTPAPSKADTTSSAAAGPRLSPGMKEAIRLVIHEGLTIAAACRAAGISEAGYYKAHLKQSVKQYHDEQERRFIQSVDALKARHKARAYHVAGRFLDDSASPADRKWAVEFFTRDDAPKRGEAAQVQVNVGAGGYDFVRPGQRIVDITPADTASPADGDKSKT